MVKRDPDRVPRSLRKFAKADVQVAGAGVRPILKRSW